MRNGLWIAGIWLLITATLAAQTPPLLPPSATLLAPVLEPPPPSNLAESLPAPLIAQTPAPAKFSEPLPPPLPPPPPFAGSPGLDYVPPPGYPGGPVIVCVPRDPFHFWIRAEYLAWWVKGAPLPASLVTAGDSEQTVLGSNANYDTFSGLRLALGGWFDTHNNIGMEASFFFLGRYTNDYSASSDGNGNPMLALPFYNRTPGSQGEYVLPIASPGKFSGNILVSTSLQLWGTEVNADFCLLRANNCEFTLLGGFRYADLQENLGISAAAVDLSNNNVTVFNDNFNTRNQFYGGQLGARFSWQGERLAFDATGKVALGATHEVVDIQGNTAQFGPNLAGSSTPGGLFTQPSNIGRYTANQFTVLPALELKLSYIFTPRSRFFIGYDFMYWNQVVRPGNQIDRNVNTTQSPVLGAGALSGPAYPMPLFNRTDFWAQGISFGFEFRF